MWGCECGGVSVGGVSVGVECGGVSVGGVSGV